VKVPCDDERDFYARLADHVAARGLRIATGDRRPVGTRLQVAVEFRNGRTLQGEAVVDAHVQLDAGPGVNVRILRFARDRDGPAAAPGPPPLPGSRAVAAPPRAPGTDAPRDGPDAATAESIDDRRSVADAEQPMLPTSWSTTASAEIGAMLQRRVGRYQRAAFATLAAAILLGAAGWAVARHAGGQMTADAMAAARIRIADRLVSEGRILGSSGALEQLVAARQLRPDDPTTNARLDRLADMLEGLGAGALQRGDLPVASVHLAAAELAAPDRASIRAKRAALAERMAVKSRGVSDRKKTRR